MKDDITVTFKGGDIRYTVDGRIFEFRQTTGNESDKELRYLEPGLADVHQKFTTVLTAEKNEPVLIVEPETQVLLKGQSPAMGGPR